MRLFFAVTISEKAQQAAAKIQEGLREQIGREGIRWESPDKFHFTLKFLGDTSELEHAQASEAARAVAQQVRPFTVTLGGIGAFPKQRRPQIVWIGVTNGVPHLTRLAEYLDRGLTERGFAPETRRFNPHLTLARIKSEGAEKAVAQTLATEAKTGEKVDKIEVIPVLDFVLMSSELQKDGSVYTVLETFALNSMGDFDAGAESPRSAFASIPSLSQEGS